MGYGMSQVPWRVYQEIAGKLDVPGETMQRINILADGVYLVAGTPPYLQYDLPSEFMTNRSWLHDNPSQAIRFCKREFGSDAAVAATLRCVGAEVIDSTNPDLETSFSLLASQIDDYLVETVRTRAIKRQVNRVRSYFDENKLELQRFKDVYDTDESPHKYCDSCGTSLDELFPYRCGLCGARFPGWVALSYAEGERQSKDAWREQMDVEVTNQNRRHQFVVLEAETSLPGWVEAGGEVGQITESGLTDLGKVVHTGKRRIQVDHGAAAAKGLVEGQQITICSSESNIATTQQVGLLHEIRQGFDTWRSLDSPAPVVAKLLAHAPRVIETLDRTTLDQPTPRTPSDSESLAGFELDDSQQRVLSDICGLEDGELSLVVGPPGSGKTEVIAKAADELANNGERVLVTSHTNIAVDNVIEKLANYSEHELARAGRPEKLSKGAQKLMLSKVVEDSDDNTVQELLERVDELKAQISERTATDTDQGELAELRRQIRELQELAEAESTRNVDITGATIIRSQLSGLAQVEFDTVVIDEASQIPVSLGLLGMVNAKKWVVVGDHNQLQPVLKTISTGGGSPPSNASLFSFLRNRYDDLERWLEYHYRSHEDIIGFAQEHVYENRIEVAGFCPRGMDWTPAKNPDSKSTAVAGGPPVAFVDVKGEQKWRQRFGAAVNEDEVNVVGKIVEALVKEHGVAEAEIGVITPFRGQRSLIADKITDFGDVEVSTVDGFQGRERAVILFSTVNTKHGGLQFGGNRNRFTVASTRPKDQFIMVGNRRAIRRNAPSGSLLQKFSRYAGECGGVFNWQSGKWIDGVDPEKTQPLRERDEPERKEPNPPSLSDDASDWNPGIGSGSNTGDSGGGTKTGSDENGGVQERVEDIVALSPTTNGELADAWDMIDGRAAWNYLSQELPEYVERNENRKIVPTEKAVELVNTD